MPRYPGSMAEREAALRAKLAKDRRRDVISRGFRVTVSHNRKATWLRTLHNYVAKTLAMRMSCQALHRLEISGVLGSGNRRCM